MFTTDTINYTCFKDGIKGHGIVFTIDLCLEMTFNILLVIM